MISGFEYKYPHLSLCILETYFENDADNKISVRPLIEKYADVIGLRIDLEARLDEKFTEQTVSEMLKSIVDMDAKKRDSIFGINNLSSLTILLELFAKSKIELIDDAIWMASEETKIAEFRKKLETKGYLKKFNDNVMRDIFRKDVEMKKKKNNNAVGVKSPMMNVKAEVIQTSNRKIQLFPAIYGAINPAIMWAIGFVSTIFFSILAVGQFVGYSTLTALQCHSLTQSGTTQTGQTLAASLDTAQKSLCDANSNAPVFGWIFVILALAGFAVAVVGIVKTIKIILHNQFAASHNSFELTHWTLTQK